jgi:hypothetical protein
MVSLWKPTPSAGAGAEGRAMHLDNTDALSTFSEWQNFLGKLQPAELEAVWFEAIDNNLAPCRSAQFHLAVIDRLMGVGHMSVQATEMQRDHALRLAESILVGLREQFAAQPRTVAWIETSIENARKFYATYGGPHGRELMFARGQVDAWGAELEPPATGSAMA